MASIIAENISFKNGANGMISMQNKYDTRSICSILLDTIERESPEFQCYLLNQIMRERSLDVYQTCDLYKEKITKWHWVNGLVIVQFLNENPEIRE